jgi:hypothetical protein
MTLARIRMSVRMRACPRHRALRPPQGRWVKWLILRSTTGPVGLGLSGGPWRAAGAASWGWMLMARPRRAVVQAACSGQDRQSWPKCAERWRRPSRMATV